MTDSEWRWFGGRPALDLINTMRQRYRGGVETLRSPQDLADWLRQAGVTESTLVIDARELRQARRLREAANTAITAIIEGRSPGSGVVREINRWLAVPRGSTALMDDETGVRLCEKPPTTAQQCLAVLAFDAATLIGTNERERLRICESDQCGMRFFDRSPAGQRRWCSPKVCGNVERARRFRARHAENEENE